jgi:hypothetical protein
MPPPPLQVGVTVPSAQPQWNSQPKVQRITLRNALQSPQRMLHLLYSAGNDSVVDITVAAAATGGATPSSLLHPRLGLNISVGDAPLPELVPVAGGSKTAARLVVLLQQALGLNSSSLDVGVEHRTRADGAVTFRVAVAKAKVCVRGSRLITVAAARLLQGIVWWHPGGQLTTCLCVAHLQVPGALSLSAALAVVPPAAQPVCLGSGANTCFWAAPVWVACSNASSNTSGSSNATTSYVATYPRLSPSCPAAAATGNDTGLSAAAVSLTGLSVAVSAVDIQAVNPAGLAFSLWGADPFNTTTLP